MSITYDDYLDGNAAAGELGMLFALDVPAAEGCCAHCGAVKAFAEARVYAQGPGIVARCSSCEAVLLRVVHAGGRMLIDLRGMRSLMFAD